MTPDCRSIVRIAGIIAGPWLAVSAGVAQAQDAVPDAAAPPTRPAIMTSRWEEDWSVLADPALRTEPFDELKYIPLSDTDPKSYVSLGLTLRERVESNSEANLGVGHTPSNTYLLQRLQFHVDLHFDENWELFTQLEDVRAFAKRSPTPVDENPLDWSLVFLAYTKTFEDGTFKARIGRQDFLFDLQRFVSSRDGPNVRQSFDAIWADWESEPWRFIGFISQPVQYQDQRPFDDTSNHHFRFSTLRAERHVFGDNELSAYYSLYERDSAHYLNAAGHEERDVVDVRFAGRRDGLDWDLEAMGQAGTVGAKQIRAWAAGTRTGYTFEGLPWQPRIGLQVDAASGNTHPNSNTLGTFNPLFPNGYYFTLAGYTGYSNLVHVKPSFTVKPNQRLTLMAAVGFQWRETTQDAVYVQPNVPLAGTAGHGGNWSGAYGQVRADYLFSANLTGAIEVVHYEIGNAIRRAGGHDGDYIGVELKFGW